MDITQVYAILISTHYTHMYECAWAVSAVLLKLLQPLSLVLMAIQDVDVLEHWLQQFLVPEMYDDYAIRVARAPHVLNHTERQHEALSAMVSILAEHIHRIAVVTNHDIMYVPWDVARAVNADAALQNMFGKQSSELAITVEHNHDSATLEMSEECWSGLALYYSPDVSAKTITMSIVWLGHAYDLMDCARSRRRSMIPATPYYMLEIQNIRRTFHTPEFIRGLETGAMWEHRNLEEYHYKISYYA